GEAGMGEIGGDLENGYGQACGLASCRQALTPGRRACGTASNAGISPSRSVSDKTRDGPMRAPTVSGYAERRTATGFMSHDEKRDPPVLLNQLPQLDENCQLPQTQDRRPDPEPLRV